MNEAAVWESLKRLMGDAWDATRHEDVSGCGIPDVSFGIQYPAPIGPVNGWLELKYLPAWPKRPTTKVRIRHWTHEQRLFLSRRWCAGRRTWVLLVVGVGRNQEWLLFPGWQYGHLKGTKTQEEIYGIARKVWLGQPTMDAFADAICQGN